MPIPSRLRRPSSDPTGKGRPDRAEPAPVDDDEPAGPHGWRRGVSRVVTVLAVLLVVVALVLPIEISRLTPGAFFRIPIEGLLGVAILLLLSTRARLVAGLGGAALGVLSILKLMDLGFLAVVARPFDPVLDWVLFDDAFGFLTDSIGQVGAVLAAIAVALIALAVPVLMTLAVLRLNRLVRRNRTAATRSVAVLTAAWGVCALLGTQLVPGEPVADSSTSAFVYGRALQARDGLADQQNFAAESAVDAFRDTPPDQLLTGLRGKDVLISFVESYGRDAVEDPALTPQVNAVLDAGTQKLDAAGFASRSAFLTSPTLGSGSGLAHATLLSGLWIDNNQRWRNLVSSDRLTLTSAFKRADWDAVGMMPGNTWAYPEGEFYGFERMYDSRNMGYNGPKFSWATMPDQFTLEAYERLVHGRPDRAPTVTQMPLLSSHAPWAPVPHMIDWNDIGDGSVFGPQATAGDPADVVWEDPARVRTEYARSVAYSVESLISYMERYGDDDLVLIFLGDHQPVPVVTGEDPSHDVPITIVAKDRSVVDRIAGWGWQDGLRPGSQAPVWRMDAFRDRFLTAFGPQPETGPADGRPVH